MLVAIENEDLMVLDPDTYETVTVRKPVMFSAVPGTEIPVVKTEKGLLAIADLS
jgi:nonsense-mediated mRNA decay protein 3